MEMKYLSLLMNSSWKQKDENNYNVHLLVKYFKNSCEIDFVPAILNDKNIIWPIAARSETQISSGRSKKLAYSTFRKGLNTQLDLGEQTLFSALFLPAISWQVKLAEKSVCSQQANIQREFSNFCPLRPKMNSRVQNLHMLANNNNNNLKN